MDLVGKSVNHKKFGNGKVESFDGTHLTVNFTIGQKSFQYPDAFDIFLSLEDEETGRLVRKIVDFKNEKIRMELEEEQRKENERLEVIETALRLEKEKKRKKKVKITRENVAFQCNYCDGGQTDSVIGFSGICSDDIIADNIRNKNRAWCSSETSMCRQYLDGKKTREELDEAGKEGNFICYESQMIKEWKANAGVVLIGKNKGKPMKLEQVQPNSLCVLTTREPAMKEAGRFIFAVFLANEAYQGASMEAGYVTTTSEYKIVLTPKEAKEMLFWNYHANDNKSEMPMWSSGLHRYFKDDEAVQILKDIVILKKDSKDKDLSERFLNHFCKINEIELETVSDANGALKRSKSL